MVSETKIQEALDKHFAKFGQCHDASHYSIRNQLMREALILLRGMEDMAVLLEIPKVEITRYRDMFSAARNKIRAKCGL